MPIRVSIVSYTNTLPFVYGLDQLESSAETSDFLITKDYPSRCAASLLSGEADIALAPVAILADNPNLHICSEYCIGANGPVDSVLLLSNVPLEQISHITLDYQSRTSNLLVQVLARYFWHIAPHYSASNEGYENSATGSEAVVVIGDRALENGSKYRYKYDLAEEWFRMTQMPFVFAAWVSTKEISTEKLSMFNDALGFGIDHLDDAIASVPPKIHFDIDDYLRNKISYPLTDQKRDALALFIKYVNELLQLAE